MIVEIVENVIFHSVLRDPPDILVLRICSSAAGLFVDGDAGFSGSVSGRMYSDATCFQGKASLGETV
jgi:hypothetical protein